MFNLDKIFSKKEESKQSSSKITNTVKVVGLTAIAGLSANTSIEAQNVVKKDTEPFVTSNYEEFEKRMQYYQDSLTLRRAGLDNLMNAYKFKTYAEWKKSQPSDEEQWKHGNWADNKEAEEAFKRLGEDRAQGKGVMREFPEGNGSVLVGVYEAPKQKIIYKHNPEVIKTQEKKEAVTEKKDTEEIKIEKPNVIPVSPTNENKSEKYILPNGSVYYSYEQLTKEHPEFLNDTVFLRNFGKNPPKH